MATGSILLSPGAAILPDGSASNAAPAVIRLQGSQSTQKLHALVLAFDGAGSAVEACYWSFVMPVSYASGGSLVVLGTINSTTGNVAVMQAQVGAVTAADTDTPLEHAFGAAATVNITANTTEARRLLSGTISLTMDSGAAGDLLSIMLMRDANHGSDSHTSDFEFWAAEFQFTVL